jgi:hypothetical protein
MRRSPLCVSCGEAIDDDPAEECEAADDHGYFDPTDEEDGGIQFADPGGNSALRAETPENPRNLPCPDCGAGNVLTPEDRACGYRCNGCANRAEMGLDGY